MGGNIQTWFGECNMRHRVCGLLTLLLLLVPATVGAAPLGTGHGGHLHRGCSRGEAPLFTHARLAVHGGCGTDVSASFTR